MAVAAVAAVAQRGRGQEEDEEPEDEEEEGEEEEGEEEGVLELEASEGVEGDALEGVEEPELAAEDLSPSGLVVSFPAPPFAAPAASPSPFASAFVDPGEPPYPSAYHPPPFRAKLVLETKRSSVSFLQAGQIFRGSSRIRWRASK